MNNHVRVMAIVEGGTEAVFLKRYWHHTSGKGIFI